MNFLACCSSRSWCWRRCRGSQQLRRNGKSIPGHPEAEVDGSCCWNGHYLTRWMREDFPRWTLEEKRECVVCKRKQSLWSLPFLTLGSNVLTFRSKSAVLPRKGTKRGKRRTFIVLVRCIFLRGILPFLHAGTAFAYMHRFQEMRLFQRFFFYPFRNRF